MITTVVAAESVVLVLCAFLVVSLLRSHAEILGALAQLQADRDLVPGQRLNPLVQPPRQRIGIGTAHDLAGSTIAGSLVAIGISGRAQNTLLCFLSSGCLGCRPFWDALNSPRPPGVDESDRVLVVTKSAGEESVRKVSELSSTGAQVVMSSQAWLDYEVEGSPYFIYIEGASSAIIGEGSAVTWDQLTEMINQAKDGANRAGSAGSSRGSRDDPTRVIAELEAAGIGPGHPSLRGPENRDPTTSGGSKE